MNKNIFIVILLVVALLVAWFIRRQVSNQPDKSFGQPVTENQRPDDRVPPGEIAERAQLSHESAIALTGNNEKDERAMLDELVAAKNVPLDFHGRVIDQDGNPLFQAQVNIGVRQWETAYKGTTKNLVLDTDTSGSFHVYGVSGDVFEIRSLIKAGYELEPKTRRTYSSVGGTVEEPIIFKMWRNDIKENVVSDSKSFKIVPDGRAYYIDLRSGTISETVEGDLKASINYSTEVVPGQTYDWGAQITVPNGGLLEETNANSSMYLAPTNGYASEFRLVQQILGGQHGSIGTRRFFLKLKNGEQYGRMEIQMNAPYNTEVPGRIRLSYAINPSGSRVLR